jgi:hypothetical protein
MILTALTPACGMNLPHTLERLQFTQSYEEALCFATYNDLILLFNE